LLGSSGEPDGVEGEGGVMRDIGASSIFYFGFRIANFGFKSTIRNLKSIRNASYFLACIAAMRARLAAI
jgi:hypothetical protein